MGKGKNNPCASAASAVMYLDPALDGASVEEGFAEKDRYVSGRFPKRQVGALNKYMKGERLEKIAKDMNMPLEQVQGYVDQLELLRSKEHQHIMANLPFDAPEWLAQAADMYLLEGRSLGDISDQLKATLGKTQGLSSSSVRRWLKAAAVPRRAPAGFTPLHRVRVSSEDPRMQEMVDKQLDMASGYRLEGREGDARNLEHSAALLGARREFTSYTTEGPFADERVLDSISAHILSIQQTSGDPVSMFSWEGVCADAYGLYFDKAYVMPNPNNPGRDVEVVDGKRVFGISNKSEFHKDVAPDNLTCGISYFATLNKGEKFGDKVNEHLSDYEEILNLRTFESVFPGTGEPARCYRVYGIPNSIIAEVAAKKPKARKGTHHVTLDSGHEVTFSISGRGEISFSKIPLELAEYKAAFWVPLEEGRGEQEG